MNSLHNNQKSLIAEYASSQLGAYTVILFGSAAKQSLRETSDVDIAYISDCDLTPYEIFMKAQGLADKLGRDVDLVDFRKASTVFKAQIVGSGQLLLDDQPEKRQYAFMRALKEYALLNEERKPIMDKLGFRGGTRN